MHVITIEGPIAYPGGKDGFFQAACSCGHYRSTLAPKREVEKSAEQHRASKENS